MPLIGLLPWYDFNVHTLSTYLTIFLSWIGTYFYLYVFRSKVWIEGCGLKIHAQDCYSHHQPDRSQPFSALKNLFATFFFSSWNDISFNATLGIGNRLVHMLIYLRLLWYSTRYRRLWPSLWVPLSYGNTGCDVFKRGVQNFWLKINMLKLNYGIF